MKNTISAVSVIREFERRGIAPDQTVSVNQGVLQMWQYGNNWVAQITKGQWSQAGKCAYVNTYSPQEIADDIAAECGASVVVGR